MKRFYNHETIKIETYEDYNTFQFIIQVPELYGLNYFEELDKNMSNFISYINSNRPTLFQIVGDFSMLKDADDEEKINFIQTVVNLFVGHMIYKNKKSNREYRLAAPKTIASLNLTQISKMSIVNYLIKFPIFSIEVLDLDGTPMLTIF